MYDSDDGGSHDDEDEAAMARAALRQLASQPAPPLRTDFQTVLARGKRRLFYQRAAASLGVVVVLVGIALGSTALARHDRPGGLNTAGGGDSVTLTTSPSTATSGWTTVTGVPATGKCDTVLSNQLAAMGLTLADQEADVLRQVVALTLAQQAAGTAKVETSVVSDKSGAWPYVGLVAVINPAKTGGVQEIRLTAWRFTGTPIEAANQTAYLNGVCVPPTRLTLDNGAVVQQYPGVATKPLTRSPAVVDVYTDKGVAYQLSTLVDPSESTATARTGTTADGSGGSSGGSTRAPATTTVPNPSGALPTEVTGGNTAATTGSAQLIDAPLLAQVGVLLAQKLG